MDLSRPYSAIATTVDGDVLVALAHTRGARSGRQLARTVRRGSQPAVNAALGRLVDQGLVRREAAPPAALYTLNRDHIGYPAVAALANMRRELFRRLREHLAGWAIAPVHASMFGSAARGDGDVASDIDLVVVRPRGIDEEDERWQEQLSQLAGAVRAWTGNVASIIELDERGVSEVAVSSLPALAAWREDAIELAGRSLAETIGEGR